MAMKITIAMLARDNVEEDDNGNVGERSDSEAQTLKWTNLVCESWLDFLSVL